jgi:hypothetical protein
MRVEVEDLLRGPHAAATQISKQHPGGATDCVEIVVIVRAPARDFWREMPSGNAPAGLGRLPLTVWQGTHFR